jgi:Protein-glutamine gamma-glutamyltransferase
MGKANEPVIRVMLLLLAFGGHWNAIAADSAPAGFATVMPTAISESSDEGIRFSCEPTRLKQVRTEMPKYLTSLGIAPDQVVTKADRAGGTLVFTLNTPKDDVDTLGLKNRPEFAIRDAAVRLPAKNGKTRRVVTVSKKEILLALLQHGRLTELSGGNCDLKALKDLVGIRQNIVAWSEDLNWIWPDGDSAEWNAKYWHRGTPLLGVALAAAFGDAFRNQNKYSIGCYTATKLVVVQGTLDYYHRVSKDRSKAGLVELRLIIDREPLVDVEPGRMWSFEKDADPGDLARPGKIAQIQYGIASRNFVPGDWVYLLNTDPVSSRKTGYEGSNAIYLGGNKFSDYYNDNKHAYTYEQKLNEVHQWRHGVFNRVRDASKIQRLSAEEFERLGRPPPEGGLVMDFRVFPYLLAGSDEPGHSAMPTTTGRR